MIKRPYFFALLLTCLMGSAQATSPREQYAMDQREAAARYAEDRAICADERNHGQRKKCLRTAENENKSALADARARMGSSGGGGSQRSGANCRDCGKVMAVTVGEQRGEGNALGVVAGGAAGALLGNQVGAGSGKTAATIAGAIGGAYVGKKIQERATAAKVWNVDVQYDNGQRRTFSFDRDPGLQRGDNVRNDGSSIMRI